MARAGGRAYRVREGRTTVRLLLVMLASAMHHQSALSARSTFA
jgi:hypothetical protein